MYLPKLLSSFINALYIGFKTLIWLYEVQHLTQTPEMLVGPKDAQSLWTLLLN